MLLSARMAESMRILNTSGDCELLTLRSQYLWALGFEVQCYLIGEKLRDITKNAEPFELVILCYTLRREQKIALIESIRGKFPSTQILELYLADAPVTVNAIEASSFRRMMRSLVAPQKEDEFVLAGVARC